MAAGFAKLSGGEEALESFERFGYEPWFATFIGACELAGAVGLWIPRVAALSASGLVVIMAGAVYNHLVHDPAEKAIPALVLGLLCAVVAWLYRADFPFGRKPAA